MTDRWTWFLCAILSICGLLGRTTPIDHTSIVRAYPVKPVVSADLEGRTYGKLFWLR